MAGRVAIFSENEANANHRRSESDADAKKRRPDCGREISTRFLAVVDPGVDQRPVHRGLFVSETSSAGI